VSRTWFYFRVTNIQKSGVYTFTISNLNRQFKLFDSGLMPVYKSIPSSPEWQTIKPQTILLRSVEKDLEVSFEHHLSTNDKEVYLAYTYPWSYTDDQEFLNKCEEQFTNDEEIYFHRELIAYSRENRRIELITISSHANKLDEREPVLPELFPLNNEIPRPFKFENKKYVFISARVHPGETAASYTFKGVMDFVLDKQDARSKAFRENFVLVLLPMLNPDGVSRGHYRMDTHGLNLNRFYINPTLEQHPTIYAAKQVMMDLHNRNLLFLYCDLHAHANQKGIFFYGNSMEFTDQVEGRLFAKLLSLNSEYFEYEKCDFSETNTSVDKGDGKDKQGAGRVAIYQATKLPRCYTLECNYAAGKTRNILASKQIFTEEQKTNNIIDELKLGEMKGDKKECLDPYTSYSFEEVGLGIGPALLDMIGKNPESRLPNGPYKSLENVKLHIGLSLLKELRFRLDAFIKKINRDLANNIEVLKTFINQGIQVEPAVKVKKELPIKEKRKSLASRNKKPADKKFVIVLDKDSKNNENEANIEQVNDNSTTVEDVKENEEN